MNKLWYVPEKRDKWPHPNEWHGDVIYVNHFGYDDEETALKRKNENAERKRESMRRCIDQLCEWKFAENCIEDFRFAYVYENINPLLYKELKKKWWMDNQNYDHKQNPFWHTMYWNPLFYKNPFGYVIEPAKAGEKRGFPYLHRYTKSNPNSKYGLNVEGPATLIIEQSRLTHQSDRHQYNMGLLITTGWAWNNLTKFYDEVEEVDTFEELEALAIEQEEQKLWSL